MSNQTVPDAKLQEVLTIQTKQVMAPGERAVLWISRVAIWIIIVLTIIPIWFVIEASFNPSNSYFSVSFFPAHPSLLNCATLFQTSGFMT